MDSELAGLPTEEAAAAGSTVPSGADGPDPAGQEGRMATIRHVSCATGETGPPASGPPSGVSDPSDGEREGGRRGETEAEVVLCWAAQRRVRPIRR